MKIKMLLIVIQVLFLFSCQDCEDCDILVREPFVPFEFRHSSELSRSLLEVTELESSIAEVSERLARIEEEFTVLTDSLVAITAAVESGDSSQLDKIERLTIELSSINSEFISLEETLIVSEDRLELLTSRRNALESGITRIDTLYNLFSGSYITFKDSSASFRIPLSTKIPETEVRMVMGNLSFDVTLGYELEIFSDDKSRIGYKAKNVEVKRHSFDSVSVDCRGNCLSENGKVVAFF